MIQKQEELHDAKTFQDVLTDHFSYHGIAMPDLFRKMILKKCFRPGRVFYGVCAVQYGEHILVASADHQEPVRTVLFVDVQGKRLNQFSRA